MKSRLQIAAAALGGLVVADLADDKLLQVLEVFVQVICVHHRSWQAQPAFDGPNIPGHPGGRGLAVRDAMSGNLRKQSPPAQWGNHAKVSYQFRCQAIVDPPFMPLLEAAPPHATQNQEKRSQFEDNTGDFRSFAKIRMQCDRQKRQENSERRRSDS